MATMRCGFDPNDLETLDRVYSVATMYIEADHLCCTGEWDKAKELNVLRRDIFASANGSRIDFDAILDDVLMRLNRRWICDEEVKAAG
jgi:hypothetical protein